MKCKAGQGNTSYLRKHLFKFNMHPKLRKCNGFNSLTFEKTAANVSTNTASAKEVKPSVDHEIEASKHKLAGNE